MFIARERGKMCSTFFPSLKTCPWLQLTWEANKLWENIEQKNRRYQSSMLSFLTCSTFKQEERKLKKKPPHLLTCQGYMHLRTCFDRNSVTRLTFLSGQLTMTQWCGFLLFCWVFFFVFPGSSYYSVHPFEKRTSK